MTATAAASMTMTMTTNIVSIHSIPIFGNFSGFFSFSFQFSVIVSDVVS
jgi:hypothetical protein